MNGGLDSHTMADLSLIGSVRGRNKHSLSIYIAARCDTSKKQEVSLRKATTEQRSFSITQRFRERQDEGADPKSSSDC